MTALLLLVTLLQPMDPATVVREAYLAFNAHDAERFVSHVAADVQWFTVTGSELKTETAGREPLLAYLQRYFKSLPTVRSRMDPSFVVGNKVAVREVVTWTSSSGERSQSALAVYEVVDGKIRRVWYYEATKAP